MNHSRSLSPVFSAFTPFRICSPLPLQTLFVIREPEVIDLWASKLYKASPADAQRF